MKNCDIFHIFAKTIACGNRLEAVLTSTRDLCFGAKIRKKCKPQFGYVKVGCKGVYIIHDVMLTPNQWQRFGNLRTYFTPISTKERGL